ncbi:MAG: hypothetical protein DCF16_07175 [Alphaproteobacteria bacterium]|nr:MAG: hypothetical protein DCF16_07175 [Alphaproteobacteria bacterium]
MAAAARLLRDPPDAFRLAMSGLHQDIDIVCAKEGSTRAEHVIEFVPYTDYSTLTDYLDALLASDQVSSSDLKGLINRYDTCVSFARASDAKEFLQSVRDALRAYKK